MPPYYFVCGRYIFAFFCRAPRPARGALANGVAFSFSGILAMRLAAHGFGVLFANCVARGFCPAAARPASTVAASTVVAASRPAPGVAGPRDTRGAGERSRTAARSRGGG